MKCAIIIIFLLRGISDYSNPEKNVANGGGFQKHIALKVLMSSCPNNAGKKARQGKLRKLDQTLLEVEV